MVDVGVLWNLGEDSGVESGIHRSARRLPDSRRTELDHGIVQPPALENRAAISGNQVARVGAERPDAGNGRRWEKIDPPVSRGSRQRRDVVRTPNQPEIDRGS